MAKCWATITCINKSRPYQGAAHIPLLISGPDISPMQVCDRPVGWHDIMPTILDLAGLDCPDEVDGQSMKPLVQDGSSVKWRDFLHGENPLSGFTRRTMHQFAGQKVEGNVAYEPGWHYLTDGKIKYIWFTGSGAEQIFDLTNDPDEKHDLFSDPAWQDQCKVWRKKLAEVLKGRPEHFSDGEQLFSGRDYPSLLPNALAIAEQRISEGYKIALQQITR